MKAGVAAAMLATRALDRARDRWRGTVIFTAVVDEEAYSIGARALVDMGLRADYCVVTESSWDRPAIGAVGKVLVRADVTGRAAHGFWPQEGINAAVEAAKLVARLDELPLGHHPRLTASQCVLALHGGNDQYVITVPEKANFTLTRNIVPGETGEQILAEMRTLADSLGSPARFDFAIEPPYYPPYEMAPDHPFLARFAQAYEAELGRKAEWTYNQGVADTNYFAADLGIPTVQFGPHGQGFHQKDEWVQISTIAGTVRVLLRLATDVLR
jgi:acetylornithine deacetylase/succinyl-diaminopimelate desuccinylase-like protein